MTLMQMAEPLRIVATDRSTNQEHLSKMGDLLKLVNVLNFILDC